MLNDDRSEAATDFTRALREFMAFVSELRPEALAAAVRAALRALILELGTLLGPA